MGNDPMATLQWDFIQLRNAVHTLVKTQAEINKKYEERIAKLEKYINDKENDLLMTASFEEYGVD